jgi:hypothetical protein
MNPPALGLESHARAATDKFHRGLLDFPHYISSPVRPSARPCLIFSFGPAPISHQWLGFFTIHIFPSVVCAYRMLGGASTVSGIIT